MVYPGLTCTGIGRHGSYSCSKQFWYEGECWLGINQLVRLLSVKLMFDLQNCLSQVLWNMLIYRRLHLKNMEESQIMSLETCHLLGHKIELFFFFIAWYGWWEVTHQISQDSFCGNELSIQHRKRCRGQNHLSPISTWKPLLFKSIVLKKRRLQMELAS